MIVLENVSLSYDAEHNVLQDVSMHLEEGKFYFLTGPSGAGKTTLLKMLALLLRPTRGICRIFGHNTTFLKAEDMPALRRKIGLVFQDHHLLDHLTIRQNVELPLKISGQDKAEIREKVASILDWVGLGECIDNFPATLSGGQKQRAAIARAVISRPKILLADEPTGNLDPALSLKIMYLFETLGESGTTVLFATHDAYLISQFSYPVFALQEGHLVPR